MNKEIYEDLFKNVVINGHYPLEKLNEMKSYIKTLNIKIDELGQQCIKQKEVIDEAIEYIKEKQKIQYKFALSHIECDDLLQILEGKSNYDK